MFRYQLAPWVLVFLASSCVGTHRAEHREPASGSARTDAESLRALVLAQRESLRARSLLTPVRVMGPTLVAFYPIPAALSSPDGARPERPDTSLASAIKRYRVIAESAGFHFTERRSVGLTIIDGANGAMYMPRDTEGQRGIVLAAPGQPVRVHLGEFSSDAVIGAVAAYLRLIGQPAGQKRAA